MMSGNHADIGRSIRLQGYAMYKMRGHLDMISYRESPRGNICAHMKHKETGERYHHWLNPQELEEFKEVKHLYPLFDAKKEVPVRNKTRKYLLKNGVSERRINNMSEITARKEVRKIAKKKQIQRMLEMQESIDAYNESIDFADLNPFDN